MTGPPASRDRGKSLVPAAHAERGRTPTLSVKMLELLVCPRSHGTLTFDADAQELVCERSRLAYPVRDGVPILLESEARAVED